MLSKTFKKGKSAIEPTIIIYANYEYDRISFILVPLRGKITLGPRPQNKIWVPFRVRFQKIRRAPPSLLCGSNPPPPPQGYRIKV